MTVCGRAHPVWLIIGPRNSWTNYTSSTLGVLSVNERPGLEAIGLANNSCSDRKTKGQLSNQKAKKRVQKEKADWE